MKTLKLFKYLVPLLFMHHCASTTKAQTPTEKKEEYRMKMVKIENGQTITIDTVFKTREDFENFHKENLKKFHPEGVNHPMPFIIKMDENGEKEIMIENGDTLLKHKILIKHLHHDSLPDMLEFDPHHEGTLKILEGELKDLPAGTTIKMVKIIAFINIEEPTKEELKNNSNAEIKNAPNEKALTVEKLNVYPNPSNGEVNLEFELAEPGKTTLLVTDLQGKEVYKEEFMNTGPGMQTRRLDLSAQAGGFYLLKIKTGEKSLVRKIVLQQTAE